MVVAPWYDPNHVSGGDLKVPGVEETIRSAVIKYIDGPTSHPNATAVRLRDETKKPRRPERRTGLCGGLIKK